MTWTSHTADAAAAIALADVFRADRAARRHFLALAVADIAKARALRDSSRPARYLRT